jgi:hypothetical protein
MLTEAPSLPDNDAPTELVLHNLSPGSSMAPMRIGALLVVAFQLACLFADPLHVPAAARVTVPLHALNLLLGVAILGATYTSASALTGESCAGAPAVR